MPGISIQNRGVSSPLDLDEVLVRPDKALYLSKDRGRKAVSTYSEYLKIAAD